MKGWKTVLSSKITLAAGPWLDEAGFVHDSPGHCEEAVHRRLARAGQPFACGCIPRLTRLTESERAAAVRIFGSKDSPPCARHAPAVRPRRAPARSLAPVPPGSHA